jgi:VWFA-related protein
MNIYKQFCSIMLALLLSVAGVFALSSGAFAEEMPNTANKLVTYKGAAIQAVTGTPSGLWNNTTIDGKSNVWYYGDTSTGNYNTGSSNSGTLEMNVDLTSNYNPVLTLDTKYQTEGGTYYDTCKIMVGSNVLWERTAQQSVDASGSFGWESLSIPLNSYAGSTVTITFSFDTKDAVANNYFGWAISNVQTGGSGTTVITPGTTSTGASLVINQLDIGNFPSIDAYVTVTDNTGASVSNLTQSDFQVLEDGALVPNFTVQSLQSGTQQALSLGLVIDESGSMDWIAGGMDAAKDAVNDFIGLSTGSQDQFGLVTIGSYDPAAIDQVLVLKDFTTDKTALQSAVSTLSATGGTPLYDGIAKALELTAQQPGLKAVIAFTDGDDTSSQSTADEVITYANSLGIAVYTIAIGYTDVTILQKIASQTGGTYTEATSTSDLSNIYAQLLGTINQQYKINFQSLDPSMSGGSSDQICVTINADLSVVTGTQTMVSDISCYDKMNMPPTIALDSVTSGYLNSGATYGTDLTIGAIVSDPDNDPITDVSLFYRTLGSSDTFTKVDMQDYNFQNNYTATINYWYYSDPGIEFYITASAGIHTKISPTNDFYQIKEVGGGNVQQIYILSPVNNDTLDYSSASGQVTFSFTKLSGVAKYVLTLELNDILNNLSVPVPIDLIPPTSGTTTPWGIGGSSGTSGTPGFTDSLLGMVFSMTLDTATWDVLALYDIKWGIEAYDSNGTLIGSTFDQGVEAKTVNNIKFLGSDAIVMTSPALGTVLDKTTSSAPLFKWNTYTGVAKYELILAHVGPIGFDSVLTESIQNLNMFTMDFSTWQSMPTGEWYWTVLGFDFNDVMTPSDFNIFNFTVQ